MLLYCFGSDFHIRMYYYLYIGNYVNHMHINIKYHDLILEGERISVIKSWLARDLPAFVSSAKTKDLCYHWRPFFFF